MLWYSWWRCSLIWLMFSDLCTEGQSGSWVCVHSGVTCTLRGWGSINAIWLQFSVKQPTSLIRAQYERHTWRHCRCRVSFVQPLLMYFWISLCNILLCFCFWFSFLRQCVKFCYICANSIRVHVRNFTFDRRLFTKFLYNYELIIWSRNFWL